MKELELLILLNKFPEMIVIHQNDINILKEMILNKKCLDILYYVNHYQKKYSYSKAEVQDHANSLIDLIDKCFFVYSSKVLESTLKCGCTLPNGIIFISEMLYKSKESDNINHLLFLITLSHELIHIKKYGYLA